MDSFDHSELQRQERQVGCQTDHSDYTTADSPSNLRRLEAVVTSQQLQLDACVKRLSDFDAELSEIRARLPWMYEGTKSITISPQLEPSTQGLDVCSQEEFDLFDAVDDEHDSSTILTSDWIGVSYYDLRETFSDLHWAQAWQGIRITLRICVARVRDAGEKVAISFKLVFIISVTLIVVVWSSWSVKRPDIPTNPRPLWARTRLEADAQRSNLL